MEGDFFSGFFWKLSGGLYICPRSIFCFSIVLVNVLKLKIMNTPTTALQRDSTAPFTHIFLSLDLLETVPMDPEGHSYLEIIRQNAERLQKLIQCPVAEPVSGL
jgi:hypothetical protein